MPHALINCKTDVGAEAESLATNLIRFCAVHPSQERTVVRIRRPTRTSASPLPNLNENRNEHTHAAIAPVRVGGDR
jgi:hypothetical protein